MLPGVSFTSGFAEGSYILNENPQTSATECYDAGFNVWIGSAVYVDDTGYQGCYYFESCLTSTDYGSTPTCASEDILVGDNGILRGEDMIDQAVLIEPSLAPGPPAPPPPGAKVSTISKAAPGGPGVCTRASAAALPIGLLVGAVAVIVYIGKSG